LPDREGQEIVFSKELFHNAKRFLAGLVQLAKRRPGESAHFTGANLYETSIRLRVGSDTATKLGRRVSETRPSLAKRKS
jgi:hypothetical protein